MIDLKFDFKSSSEDAYSIKLSSYDDSFFSTDVYKRISKYIDVVNIDLSRVRGNGTTSIKDLMKLTDFIAKIFLKHNNIVIGYYCDFLSQIPHTFKNITSQEYRSRLFSLLFRRYIKQNNIIGIDERILTIHGAEDYYIHLIYRKKHASFIDLIASDIHLGYDKP